MNQILVLRFGSQTGGMLRGEYMTPGSKPPYTLTDVTDTPEENTFELGTGFGVSLALAGSLGWQVKNVTLLSNQEVWVFERQVIQMAYLTLFFGSRAKKAEVIELDEFVLTGANCSAVIVQVGTSYYNTLQKVGEDGWMLVNVETGNAQFEEVRHYQKSV